MRHISPGLTNVPGRTTRNLSRFAPPTSLKTVEHMARMMHDASHITHQVLFVTIANRISSVMSLAGAPISV